MTTRFALLALSLLALLALGLTACSGGGSDEVKFPETVIIKEGDITPILANSELVVGLNRIAIGILDRDGVPIVDAKVKLTFYDLNGGQTVKKEEFDAVSRVPARDAGIAEQIDITNPDGSRRTQFNVGEDVGIYTAMVTFERGGNWGLKIDVDSTKPKVKQTVLPRFNVLEKGITPAIGSPAPRSRNLTAADVTDLTIIDTSPKPSVEMHTSTIADAIAAGKPTLVLFAVPGYCESRLCGPELEIMRKLFPKYRDRAEFIHVEFYKDPSRPNKTPVDAVREWNLRSEPWFFLIDKQGNIAAKFEGPTSLQELDEAMQVIAP
ncbi:MAG TPA: hypothetical protein VJB57_04670 [Dehalococcoidia bacterium]|nr:hypothetical protein [Dehalococcoidia bacterium]